MYDLIVIGGGPAGLACALKANALNVGKILIIERDGELGGVLNQCIHNGFGLHLFKQELTGPEFAEKLINQIKDTDIEVMLNTMVVNISENKEVQIVNKDGCQNLEAKAIVLSMGCRERTRGAIAIPGTRAAGVFTAGTAQRYMNIDGYSVGKRVVILGSGDIGLIMARRLTLEGSKVLACVEINPYSSGLQRNITQCLSDYDIPLYLSHTIIDIKGDKRVEQVVVAKVDESFKPIKGSEIVFDCDTVLLSVGLIPENELSKKAGIQIDNRTKGPVVYENMETRIPGVFACGNVVQVHDLADNVALEAQKTAQGVYDYLYEKKDATKIIEVKPINHVTYSVPQHIHLPQSGKLVDVSFRSNKVFGKCKICVKDIDGKDICQFNREYITPGELQKISLPLSLIEKLDKEISVGITEVSNG